MLKITSKDNKLIKSVKKLLDDKKYRDVTNLFIAESARVIETLIKNKVAIRNLLVSVDSRYFARAKEYENQGIDVVLLSNNIFNSLTTLSNSDGLIAVCNKPKNIFNFTPNGKYVVLDKIQNPGNLGTIIRTAVGLNFDGVIISNDSVDIFNPTIIRSTMGACFSIPIKIVTNLTDTIAQLKKLNIKVYGTALNKTAKPLDQISFGSTSIAVLFGNEGNGLKDSDLKLCDEIIYIPISNKIDSLNVSIAVGIILYQICKQ
ncbi:MAG: RNA methyltransferase [Mycoplasmataceae bacterium]|jgi:TrmH family RNA methyltransferase|nr:RNA methyltransferase [Mycoplasmataceae bacterium]